MAERAVFLDRDNTIVEDKEGYIGDPAKVRLLPGAATAIASMRRLGYRIIVVSNQSGVARGMFDEAAVESVNQEMCRQLRDQGGAHVDASYYCPYHPDGTVAEYKMEHDWRKPKPGMLKQAAEDFGLDLSQCWMVGDALRDVECGLAGRCRTILLQDPNRPSHGDDPAALTVSPHFIVKTLADAARVIAREGRAVHREIAKLTEQANPESHPAEPAGVNSGTDIKSEPKTETPPEPLAVTPTKEDPVAQAEAPTAITSTTEAIPDPGVTAEEKSALAAKAPEPAAESKPAATEPVAAAAVTEPVAEPDPAKLVTRPRPLPHPALQAASAKTRTEPASPAGVTTPVKHDTLKPVVDEILSLLRQRHRAQEMPEFTLSRFIALLAQIGVFVCFIMAIWDGVSSMPSPGKEWAQQSLVLYRGIMWMLGAVALQVMVLSLHSNARQR